MCCPRRDNLDCYAVAWRDLVKSTPETTTSITPNPIAMYEIGLIVSTSTVSVTITSRTSTSRLPPSGISAGKPKAIIAPGTDPLAATGWLVKPRHPNDCRSRVLPLESCPILG